MTKQRKEANKMDTVLHFVGLSFYICVVASFGFITKRNLAPPLLHSDHHAIDRGFARKARLQWCHASAAQRNPKLQGTGVEHHKI